MVLPSHPTRLVADRLAGSRESQDLLAALDLLLDDRRALVAWLRSTVADPERLDRVAAASYWHANGFAKLVLHDGPGFRIRLHVWPAGEDRRGEPDPHSHRWDFASTVLAGAGLEVVEYEELLTSVSGEDAETVRYAYYGRSLVPDTKVFLRRDREFEVLIGDRYETVTTRIHTVAPKGDDLVATLLVQGPHTNPAAVVYGEGLDARGSLGHAVDADAVRALVTGVVAALDARG
ncbi:hypothetical protein [Pseudonocardia humida]|uniref:Uncharacterized protein n=1 Tax=Pseudonocardia humida TaxID=2800819 RepID=A0ABT1A4A9_9PSEU|nr:hypothetical protein [Pseudonocardia humida]MCO1657837.1 hypothetical protein [Pseudonocardia humida]